MSPNPSRRDFLRHLALGATGYLLAPLALIPIPPALAAGGTLQTRVANHIASLRAQGLIGAKDRVS